MKVGMPIFYLYLNLLFCYRLRHNDVFYILRYVEATKIQVCRYSASQILCNIMELFFCLQTQVKTYIALHFLQVRKMYFFNFCYFWFCSGFARNPPDVILLWTCLILSLNYLCKTLLQQSLIQLEGKIRELFQYRRYSY